MIANSTSNDVLLGHLLARFRHKPISKSTLVMACHYFLRDNCESSCNKVEKIEGKITDLLNRGLLIKQVDGTMIIAHT